VAAPFKQAEFDILYNTGVSREGELLDLAVDRDIVKKSGTWFSYGEERLGQGRENARLFLLEHPDLASSIEAAVRQAAGIDADSLAAKQSGAAPPASGAEAAAPPEVRESGRAAGLTAGASRASAASGDGTGRGGGRGSGPNGQREAERSRGQAGAGRGGSRTALASRRGKA
jgi:hypothetical protein